MIAPVLLPFRADPVRSRVGCRGARGIAARKRATVRKQSFVRDLDALEAARRTNLPEPSVVALIEKLEAVEIDDPRLVERFHDALLFLRAYPQSRRVARLCDAVLRSFRRRIDAVREHDEFDPLLELDVAGIIGTSIETNSYTYDCVKWLAARSTSGVSIDWDLVDAPDRVAALLRRFLPLLEEESSADANLAIDEWLRAARVVGHDGGLRWLLQNLDRLDLSTRLRAELFDALGLWIRWDVRRAADSRTSMRRAARLHSLDGPLIGRRDVSIEHEINSKPMPVTRLSRREGSAVLDMARAAMATRYRELYGFTHGDPSAVISADAGRGFEILLCGIGHDRRLPLRAGFGTLLVRNGVPVGYADAYGIGERLEISLNIFYAFRDGESAWCFARMLALYSQLFRSAVFSLDSYQIGKGNKEAIASGAFWFYRKLGFRSTSAEVEALARREEARMAERPGYRTNARTLEKLASSNVVYEAPGHRTGLWDAFHIRNVGLAVQKAMAASGRDAGAFRRESCARAAGLLGVRRNTFDSVEQQAFERMAPVIAILPSLERWSEDDRHRLVDVIRAKASAREVRFLELTARHPRFQDAVRRLGSRHPAR